MATEGTKIPISHSMSTPTSGPVHHAHGYFQPSFTSWWHPWSSRMPAPHSSPFFNPRTYDAVAPWAYEQIPLANFRGSFSGLTPIERDIWNSKHNLESMLHQGHRHSFSNELNLHPSRPGSLLEHYSLLNPIRTDDNGNRWLNVYFDLRSYKPEEIKVTLDVKERCISVEASHEVQESKEHYIKRNYHRKVFIPADLNIDLSKIELKSCLTNEGLLVIEAALPKLNLDEARSPSISKDVLTQPSNVYTIPVKSV